MVWRLVRIRSIVSQPVQAQGQGHVYGTAFVRRLRAVGIRDRPIAPRSPWQNAYVERLIGSIRRECLDRMIVFSAAHLRRILKAYAAYYNEVRTRRSLRKDAPIHRAVQRIGDITSQSVIGDCTIGTCESNFRYRQDPAGVNVPDNPTERRKDGLSAGEMNSFSERPSLVRSLGLRFSEGAPVTDR